MNSRKSSLFALVIAIGANLATPCEARLQFTIRGILVGTGAVAGAISAHQLDCWRNMGVLAANNVEATFYPIGGSVSLPTEVNAALYALNAGCALALVLGAAGGTEAVCRIGEYIFDVKDRE